MQVLGVSLDTLMSPEEEGEEEQEGEELETLSAVQSITAAPTMCLGKTRAEVEFLDISLTKKTRFFCSMLFTVLSNGGLYRKQYIPNYGFKNPYKKSAKQENSSLFMNSIL